jgi:hypothetical protein
VQKDHKKALVGRAQWETNRATLKRAAAIRKVADRYNRCKDEMGPDRARPLASE